MATMQELAELAWSGARAEADRQMARPGQLLEVVPGVALTSGFGQSITMKTGDGLVVVDTSGVAHGQAVVGALREWSTEPVRRVVYTHGHFDHVGGMAAFDADAQARGYERPHVIAHENVPKRFDRYTRTSGYNAVINARQFGARPLSLEGQAQWERWRQPDETYAESMSFEQGGMTFELQHGKGETDDHTWVWVPSLKLICAGDFFIWRTPNAGNPQKVQRYPEEWAVALRAMAAMGAEVFVPSHGFPIYGSARIQQALGEAAELLETLVEQTLELLNRGVRLDEVIHTVRAPEELLRAAVPGAAVRRAGVHRPECVADVWRLVGWEPGDGEAGARGGGRGRTGTTGGRRGGARGQGARVGLAGGPAAGVPPGGVRRAGCAGRCGRAGRAGGGVQRAGGVGAVVDVAGDLPGGGKGA